eukprot:4056635-Pyramimonas_sp.AAC.1
MVVVRAPAARPPQGSCLGGQGSDVWRLAYCQGLAAGAADPDRGRRRRRRRRRSRAFVEAWGPGAPFQDRPQRSPRGAAFLPRGRDQRPSLRRDWCSPSCGRLGRTGR